MIDMTYLLTAYFLLAWPYMITGLGVYYAGVGVWHLIKRRYWPAPSYLEVERKYSY